MSNRRDRAGILVQGDQYLALIHRSIAESELSLQCAEGAVKKKKEEAVNRGDEWREKARIVPKQAIASGWFDVFRLLGAFKLPCLKK